jgi:hypothetical protein
MILSVNRDHFLKLRNKLVDVMVTVCVLFEVWTEFLSKLTIRRASALKG